MVLVLCFEVDFFFMVNVSVHRVIYSLPTYSITCCITSHLTRLSLSKSCCCNVDRFQHRELRREAEVQITGKQSLAEGTVRARGLAGESEVDEVTQAQSTSHCTSVARLHVVAVTPVNAVNTCTESREERS